MDQALCFGWIDGVRKSLGERSYTIRFTPRKAGSTWSAVNVKRARELIAEGRMYPAGLDAFARRLETKTAVYSYEQPDVPTLSEEMEERFRANLAAWNFFQGQAPSYRRAAIWWVISAKREETKAKRLTTLIEDSARGRTVPPLTRPAESR